MHTDQPVLDKTHNTESINRPTSGNAEDSADHPANVPTRNDADGDLKFDHQVPYQENLPPQAPASAEIADNPANLPAAAALDMSNLDATGKSEGLLTDYTMQQLQLRSQPFIGASADGELFADELTYSHINEIRQLLIDGEALIMIEGELGAGKTTLLKQLTKTTGQRLQFFSVKGGEKYTTHNLFNGILNAWQLETHAGFDDATHEMMLALQVVQERNNFVVLLFDDVDQIPARELNVLIASLQYFNTDQTIVQMVMTAEPAFEKTSENLLRNDLKMDYVSIFIEPMLASRALPYIQLRLNQSGHFDDFPLTDKQVATIANDASGLPGRINFLSAETLNHQYSPFVQEGSGKNRLGGFTRGRTGRLLLGLLALGLVLAGLLWRSPDNTNDEGFRTVERAPLSTPESTPETSSNNLDIATGSDTSAEVESATEDVTAQESESSLEEEPPAADTSVEQAVTATEAASETEESIPEESQEAANTENPSASEDDPIADSEAVTTAESEAVSVEEAATETLEDKAIETEPATDTESPSSETDEATDVVSASDDTAEEPEFNLTSTESSNTANDSQTSEDEAEPTAVEPSTSAPPSDSTDDSDAELPTTEPEASANTDSAAEVQADDVTGTESPNWVLLQETNKFTIQMSASTDRVDVTRFLDRSGLDGPNSIYSFERNGRTWFALVHGLYDSVEEARASIETMQPAAVSNQPWIRRISSIQRSLGN